MGRKVQQITKVWLSGLGWKAGRGVGWRMGLHSAQAPSLPSFLSVKRHMGV